MNKLASIDFYILFWYNLFTLYLACCQPAIIASLGELNQSNDYENKLW